MKKWTVGITIMFNLKAESKKEAVREALDRLECVAEEGYYWWAMEAESDDSEAEGLTDVLKQIRTELGIP